MVTNRDYEFKLNDEKRNIVLVEPAFMKNINRDIDTFLNNA